jgi:hypothetical protein
VPGAPEGTEPVRAQMFELGIVPTFGLKILRCFFLNLVKLDLQEFSRIEYSPFIFSYV